MGKVRLGVIGAGSWTVSSHLPNLARYRSEVEFTIVNRRNADLVTKIKDRFGFAKASVDWRDVIEERPHIIVVGSPPSLHWEQAKAALEVGAAVLCEKPFTLQSAHAWDLDETSRRTGRPLFIAYGWNYRPMVVEARRLLLEDGGIGQIEQMSVHMDSVTRELLAETGGYPDAAPEFRPEPESWSRPKTSGGGYAQAQLTHALGVALWLTGLRGSEVFAFMSSPLGAQVELHDALAVRYSNGAIGTIGGGSSHVGGADNRHAVDIRLIGSRGQYRVDLRDNILWRYRNPADDVLIPLDPHAGLYDCVGPVDALVAAALGRPTPNNSSPELGARTVEIIEAAYQSARSAAPVKIGGGT